MAINRFLIRSTFPPFCRADVTPSTKSDGEDVVVWLPQENRKRQRQVKTEELDSFFMLYRLIGLVNNRGLTQEKEPGQDGLGDKDGRNAPLPLPGLPLVNPEDQEGQKIDADEIDDECSHGRLNADPVRYDLSMQM